MSNRKSYHREYRRLHKEQRLQYNRKYRASHREGYNKNSREYYAKNRGRLIERAKEYYGKHREERLAYHRRYRSLNRERVLSSMRASYRKNRRERIESKRKEWDLLKSEVLGHYSNASPKCKRCDVSDIRALTIDHIGGDGRKHLMNIGIKKGGYKLYGWLKKNNYPKGFQVLCMNCQFIKRYENNELKRTMFEEIKK